jgi:GH43 family beta-xylosidase
MSKNGTRHRAGRVIAAIAAVCMMAGGGRAAGQVKLHPLPQGMFTNPLLPTGPDPWVIYRNGFYYYTNTTGTNLTLWKTRDITDLRDAEQKIVWTPPKTGPYSSDIWAPELHYLDGAWYLYFAADAGTNDSHRLYVLRNANADPLRGRWEMKGKVEDRTDRWAIDPTVVKVLGKTYLAWSGWEGDTNGRQSLYMARLKNPWTVEGERIRLSTPQYAWEEVGDTYVPGVVSALPHVNVNEGPEFLVHGSKVFLVYSASACWTDYYELGLLEAPIDSDLMQVHSWTKLDHPVFRQSPAASVYGPGHNSFFQSPDGRQDWILYHANAAPGQGCGLARTPRAQPFTWNPDGTPNFGQPVPAGMPMMKPSGTAGAGSSADGDQDR